MFSLNFRRAGHHHQLPGQAVNSEIDGNQPEECQRIADRKLRPDPGLLPQELRQPQLRRSADPSRVHEASPSLYQLPPQVRRAFRRRRRRLRRSRLPDAQHRLHGRRNDSRLLLPSPASPARPQPSGGGQGHHSAPSEVLHREGDRRRSLHLGERHLHVLLHRAGCQSGLDQRCVRRSDSGSGQRRQADAGGARQPDLPSGPRHRRPDPAAAPAHLHEAGAGEAARQVGHSLQTFSLRRQERSRVRRRRAELFLRRLPVPHAQGDSRPPRISCTGFR